MNHLRLALVLAAFVALVAGCGGDDDGDASGEDTPTSEAAASATATDEDGRLTAESAYIRDLCTRDKALQDAIDAVPRYSEDTSTLTFEERRSRAQAIWPALAGLYEGYVEETEAITPPESAESIHAAIIELNRIQGTELRRSLSEFDAIFLNPEALEANNARLTTAEDAGYANVDASFNAAPELLELYETVPECQ